MSAPQPYSPLPPWPARRPVQPIGPYYAARRWGDAFPAGVARAGQIEARLAQLAQLRKPALVPFPDAPEAKEPGPASSSSSSPPLLQAYASGAALSGARNTSDPWTLWQARPRSSRYAPLETVFEDSEELHNDRHGGVPVRN